MLDSNKTISGLWIGPALSAMEQLCIHSFAAHGHNFVLYAYNDIAGVPNPPGEGGRVEVRDANEILPKKHVFHAQGTYSGFSDWFRWELMRQKGGWYSDMDTVCLRPWDFAEEVVFGEQSRDSLGAGILKFPAGHPMAAAMTDACAHPNKIQPWDNEERTRRKRKRQRKLRFWQNPHKQQEWGESGGPDGLSLAAPYFNVRHIAQPADVFFPVYFASWYYCIQGGPFYDELGDAIIQHSHAVHLCGNMWRTFGADKNGSFPRDSLYEKLKRRYLPQPKQ